MKHYYIESLNYYPDERPKAGDFPKEYLNSKLPSKKRKR